MYPTTDTRTLQFIHSENAVNVQSEFYHVQSRLLIIEALQQRMFLMTCLFVTYHPLFYGNNANFRYRYAKKFAPVLKHSAITA